jgi:diacylglycerol kinase
MGAGDPARQEQRRSTGRADSFRHAFAGWGHLLRTQPNARIHLFFTVAALLMGLWLRITLTEWGLVALAAGLVWAAEFFNTALEAAVNLASPDLHPLARISKDTAAGAVLAAAGTAVIVGGLIFGPKLLAVLWPSLAGLLMPD